MSSAGRRRGGDDPSSGTSEPSFADLFSGDDLRRKREGSERLPPRSAGRHAREPEPVPIEFVVPDPGEPLCAHRPGVQRRVLRRLRRGEPRPQDEVDLHGLGAARARAELRDGLSDAVARGLRCLRIIHGRGRGSKGGTPVLKRELPRWLAEAGVGEHVVAFAPAPPEDGGAGATLVLLQRS